MNIKKMMNKLFGKCDYFLFTSMIVISVAIVILAVVFPIEFTTITQKLTDFTIENVGWWLALCNILFLVFIAIMAFSKYGDIKLGKKDDKPDYSFFNWFCMLFSCGLGVALYYSCVSEPISHYFSPPYIAAAETAEAASLGLQIGIFHLGIATWSNFTVVGLVMAYFAFTKSKPLTLKATLEPVFGASVYGSMGKAIDWLTIFATLGGVATSIGVGVLQLKYGMSWLTGQVINDMTIAIVFIIMLLLYTTTAASGVSKGIKHLSSINMFMAFFLLGYLFLFGPTVFQLDMMVQSTGELVKNLPQIISFTDAAETTDNWTGTWTTFYYCWTISWAPFVGGFVARISRGRTVREFIVGVMGVPVLFTIVWYSVFGGSALYAQMNGTADIFGAMSPDMSAGIYTLLETLPFSKIIGVIVMINIVTFLATSANSAAYFNSSIIAKGQEPKVNLVILSALVMGAVGLILMFAGGQEAVQSSAIATASIFSVIMVLMMVSMIKSLTKKSKQKD